MQTAPAHAIINNMNKKACKILIPALMLAAAVWAAGCTASVAPEQAALTATAAATEALPAQTPVEVSVALVTPVPTPTCTPSPTPTPTETPAPTPVPDDALDAGALDRLFDGAVFVGDSLTRNLNSYVLKLRDETPGFLGSAQFLCAHNYSLKTAASTKLDSDKVNLSYQGRDVTLCQGVEKTGAKRVYFMAGLNNYIGYNVDDCCELYATIYRNLREMNPEIEVVFCGITPVLASYRDDTGKEYNESLRLFCNKICDFCAENEGAYYMELFSALLDDNGCLRREWCSDGVCHLNAAGEDVWIRTLRQHARSMYEQGLWTLPAE